MVKCFLTYLRTGAKFIYGLQHSHYEISSIHPKSCKFITTLVETESDFGRRFGLFKMLESLKNKKFFNRTMNEDEK